MTRGRSPTTIGHRGDLEPGGEDEFERPRSPIEGYDLRELAAALEVVEASAKSGRVRILRVEALHDGQLLVEIGFRAAPRAGGGRSILLRRTEGAWVIVKEMSWRS